MDYYYIEKVEITCKKPIGFQETDNDNVDEVKKYKICYILLDKFVIEDSLTVELLMNFKKYLDIYNKINNCNEIYEIGITSEQNLIKENYSNILKEGIAIEKGTLKNFIINNIESKLGCKVNCDVNDFLIKIISKYNKLNEKKTDRR